MKHILLVALAITLSQIGYAQTDAAKTNWHISAAAFLNTNIYSSNFADLPGYESCCTNYTSAVGFAPAFGAGLQYAFPEQFLGLNYSYMIRFLYSDISAKYSIDEHIGNNITGNSYQKIISNFILDANIKTLAIENSIIISPKIEIPIDFNVGLQVAVPMTKDIFKVERLKSPSNLTYTDTGSRERAKQSGELVDASSALLSVLLGARYKVAQFDNFAVYPELQFALGLSNIVSSRQWKSSVARAGVSLSYNIPKKEIVPIAPPINPPMPQMELPQIEEFDFTQKYIYADVELRDSIEIPIPLFKHYVLDYLIYPPVLFFKKGSDELNHSYSANTDFGKNIDPTSVISKFFKDNRKDVVITINTTNDEPDALFEKRKNKILELIRKADERFESKYTFEHNKVDISKMKDAITDEARVASIRNVDSMSILLNSTVIKSESSNSSNRNVIFFKASVPQEFELSSYKLSCVYEGKELYSTTDLNGRINLIDDYFLHNGIQKTPLSVTSSATISDGRTKTKAITIMLAPYYANASSVFNIEGGEGEKLFLGMFDYDSYKFKYFDKIVFGKVRDRLARGKRIRIIPYTDDIGGKVYNLKLAEKRAEAAVNLLELSPEQYEIKYPNSYLFDNKSPVGRMLNRSVIIEYAD